MTLWKLKLWKAARDVGEIITNTLQAPVYGGFNVPFRKIKNKKILHYNVSCNFTKQILIFMKLQDNTVFCMDLDFNTFC